MSTNADLDFELRLVRVNWAGKDDVASIESAQHPISLHRNSSYELFTAEVPAYPKIDGLRHGQLAISVNTDTPPQIGSPEGPITMESVLDTATGKTWWIEKGDWKSILDSSVAPGYHDAPSCRHGGTLLLHIDNQRCHVHFTPPGFDQGEFEELLRDFQDECWQLILSDKSYTTTPSEGKSTIPGEEFIEHARAVLQATTQILMRPHRELREVQRLQHTARVRPVPRTFMELASKGWPKKVTGRGHTPDYNTPENQYIASIIERLLRAVHFLLRGGQARRDRLIRQISGINQRIDNMEEGIAKVDPVRLENFAEREERPVQEWRARAQDSFPIRQRHVPGTFDIKVIFRVKTEPTTKFGGRLSFYVDSLEGGESVTRRKDNLFRFECNFADVEFFEKGVVYKADLTLRPKESRDKNNKLFTRWNIKGITRVDVVRSEQLREAKYLREKASKIKSGSGETRKDSFMRQWEREEQNREREGLKKRAHFYDQVRAQWGERLEALGRLQRDLSEMRRRFKQRSIETSPHARYTSTMVFIEQPAYRAAHAAYQDLQGASGFREDLFDSLLSLDDLSILDLPTVYERWCLLQIVRVLEEEYEFKPVVGSQDANSKKFKARPYWRKDMVDTVCQTSEQPFTIHFYSYRLQRHVIVTYQAQLENGMRPDFLLEVRGNNTQGNGEETSTQGSVRVVLDAKFKQYSTDPKSESYRNTISNELDKLVNKKDYAERDRYNFGGVNNVFVLHPSEDSVPKPTTFQDWATSSYYGGDEAFEWQEAFPSHEQGAILVRPQKQDDLKRLVYMILSYSVEENDGVYDKTGEVDQQLFCVVCGGKDMLEIEKAKRSKGRWYLCQNHQCQHFMVLNYCGTCGHRLWKHGSYWTFHDTHPLSPYNIKCPTCGSYLPASKEGRD